MAFAERQNSRALKPRSLPGLLLGLSALSIVVAVVLAARYAILAAPPRYLNLVATPPAYLELGGHMPVDRQYALQGYRARDVCIYTVYGPRCEDYARLYWSSADQRVRAHEWRSLPALPNYPTGATMQVDVQVANASRVSVFDGTRERARQVDVRAATHFKIQTGLLFVQPEEQVRFGPSYGLSVQPGHEFMIQASTLRTVYLAVSEKAAVPDGFWIAFFGREDGAVSVHVTPQQENRTIWLAGGGRIEYDDGTAVELPELASVVLEPSASQSEVSVTVSGVYGVGIWQPAGSYLAGSAESIYFGNPTGELALGSAQRQLTGLHDLIHVTLSGPGGWSYSPQLYAEGMQVSVSGQAASVILGEEELIVSVWSRWAPEIQAAVLAAVFGIVLSAATYIGRWLVRLAQPDSARSEPAPPLRPPDGYLVVELPGGIRVAGRAGGLRGLIRRELVLHDSYEDGGGGWRHHGVSRRISVVHIVAQYVIKPLSEL